jgi:hypothetical protein
MTRSKLCEAHRRLNLLYLKLSACTEDEIEDVLLQIAKAERDKHKVLVRLWTERGDNNA